MRTKKLFSIFATILLFGIVMVSAQGSIQNNKFTAGEKLSTFQLEQHKNMFQNQYNFTCQGICNYSENAEGEAQLQVREQKRFLFWDVSSEETYTLNDEGEIIQARYNIWSRILNRNKLRVNN